MWSKTFESMLRFVEPLLKPGCPFRNLLSEEMGYFSRHHSLEALCFVLQEIQS
jgi:hypothetical protein